MPGIKPARSRPRRPSGGSAIQYAETMASSVLGFLPLLAVFLILQRQIVQGVANTGIK
jgi:multiple sugar transport system permease protein